MLIQQTNHFKNTVKKLHPNQKKDLDVAVKFVMNKLDTGVLKKGDLTGVRVYKFKMVKQLTLLAYTYTRSKPKLTLLALGSHENFYRDIKHLN